LGLANVNVILGITPPALTLFHVMKKMKTMREIVEKTEYGIDIIAGASGFSRIANLTEDERQNFINELESLSDADIIIIDTSAGVSNNVLDFVAAADDVVIVTTPETTAITDAYGLIKIIATEPQYDNLNMGLNLVVNRVKSVVEANQVSDRMITIAGQFLNLKVERLGFIYEDSVVSQAVKVQRPFTRIDPKSKASICVMDIVKRLEKTGASENISLRDKLRRFITRRSKEEGG